MKRCWIQVKMGHVCDLWVQSLLGWLDFWGMSRARAQFSCPGRWFWGSPPLLLHSGSRVRVAKTTKTRGRSLKNRFLAPRWPQDGPRWPQDGPKMAQDGPQMAQDDSRWPKMAPRLPSEGPKMTQDGSKKALK